MPDLFEKCLRYACYYRDLLKIADELYEMGGDSVARGIAMFDAEWDNIRNAHDWLQLHQKVNIQVAELSVSFPQVGAYLLNLRQPLNERLRWLRTAATGARRFKWKNIESKHLNNLGATYRHLGKPALAIKYHKKALSIFKELGDKAGIGQTLNNLGLAHMELTLTTEAVKFYEESLSSFREANNVQGEGEVLYNLGELYISTADPITAIKFFELDLTVVRRIRDRRGEGYALVGLGIAYDTLGNASKAIEFLEQGLQIAREIGDILGEAEALFNLSKIFIKLRNVDKARDLAGAAVDLFEQLGESKSREASRQLSEWALYTNVM